MSLLTIPPVPTKGSFQNYGLNQADLIALVSQTYFQDKANWKKVILTYVSSVSNQISLITFSPDELINEVIAPGFFSDEARASFLVQNISIYDKQNGRFRLERSQIPNVENYDLLFTSGEAGSTFLGLSSSFLNTALSIDVNDSNKLIYGFTDSTEFNTISSFIMPLSLDGNGSFDSALQLNLKDTAIQTFFANDALTKAWVVGQFGTSLNGKALPPVPVDPNYNNPARIVEIDLATGDVTLKADIPNGGIGFYFGSSIESLMIDESLNLAFIRDNARIGCFNMVTGSLSWGKNAGAASSGYYETKEGTRMYQDSGFIYTQFASYNNIPVSNNVQIYKLSKTTGDRDLSLPDIPMTDVSSNGLIYSISPDATKIVMSQNSTVGYGGFRVFSSGSWSSFFDVKITSYHIFCSVSNVYVYGSSGDPTAPYYQGGTLSTLKFDYSFNFDSIVAKNSQFAPFSPNPYQYAKMGVKNGKVYCTTSTGRVVQFDETTGNRNTLFDGIIASGQVQQLGRFTFYSGNKMIIDNFYNQPYYPMNTITDEVTTFGVAIIDIPTRSIIHRQNISNPLQSGAISPMTSSSQPNLLFTAGGSDLKVYDTSVIPWTNVTSGWPVRPGTGAGWSGAAIDGNFMYITGAGTLNFNDGAGSFAANNIARINLTTKLVDRTFTPSGLSGLTGQDVKISFTDNYIYLAIDPYFGGGANPFRIKKSDNSVQELTTEVLGLTNAVSGCCFNFVQIDTNKLVIYTDKGPFNYSAGVGSNTTLDGRIYIIVSEDSFALSGPQIAADNSQVGFRLKYCPVNNTLGGYIRVTTPTNGMRFAYFDLATNARTFTTQYLQYAGGNDFDPTQSGKTGYSTPMVVIGEDYFTMGNSAVLSRELYNGILKMKPVGIINN